MDCSLICSKNGMDPKRTRLLSILSFCISKESSKNHTFCFMLVLVLQVYFFNLLHFDLG